MPDKLCLWPDMVAEKLLDGGGLRERDRNAGPGAYGDCVGTCDGRVISATRDKVMQSRSGRCRTPAGGSDSHACPALTPSSRLTPAASHLHRRETRAIMTSSSQESDLSASAFPPAHDAVVDNLRALATANDAAAGTLHVRSGALFARLKALNRDANGATRTHKQATADARQEMDQTHLGLQNLLYEKRHLEREIDKCRMFAYVLRTTSRLVIA